MDIDHQEIAEKIRDASYFTEARKWYDVVYLNPIAERVFFIVLTILAGIIFLFSLAALNGLMPLNPSQEVVYKIPDIVNLNAQIKPLKTTSTEDPNQALLRYFLTEYIRSREEYSEQEFRRNYRHVQQQSTPGVLNAYTRQVSPSNPRSPLVLYEKHSTRSVEFRGLKFSPENPNQAQLLFTATVNGPAGGGKKTNWTALVGFDYSPLIQQEITDPQTGELALDVTPPSFKVVSYEVRPYGQ